MTTRSHKEADTSKGAAQSRELMHAILGDLAALERMIAEGRFETGVRRIGAEQEMFLVDDAWAPATGAMKMMEKLKGDPHFTTELGQFQLEANADPQSFGADGIARMH